MGPPGLYTFRAGTQSLLRTVTFRWSASTAALTEVRRSAKVFLPLPWVRTRRVYVPAFRSLFRKVCQSCAPCPNSCCRMTCPSAPSSVKVLPTGSLGAGS